MVELANVSVNGGTGSVITSISQTDGKISATSGYLNMVKTSANKRISIPQATVSYSGNYVRSDGSYTITNTSIVSATIQVVVDTTVIPATNTWTAYYTQQTATTIYYEAKFDGTTLTFRRQAGTSNYGNLVMPAYAPTITVTASATLVSVSIS